MNPFIVEQKRFELLNTLPSNFSRARLFLLIEFYTFLFNAEDHNIVEAYTYEFLDDLLIEIDNYNALYIQPETTKKIIKLLELIRSVVSKGEYEKALDSKTELVKERLNVLNKLLNGEVVTPSNNLSFPLLFKASNQVNSNLGILESVRIKITKAKGADSFIVIPSQQKIDEQLDQQIKTSFQFALEYVGKFSKRLNTFHEVIIYFENRSACYEGNSLGIAIAVGFIEELTKYYNLPYLVHIKENITSTGGLESNGKVLPISGNHIQDKVEVVFFSSTEHFIIPKEDEADAITRLTVLKDKYPKRNLILVVIENIYDLLDRRSIVEIKKQSPVVRTAKAVKKNWIASILFLLLSLILFFVFIKDWDENPYSFGYEGNNLLVKNKYGKILWELPTWFDAKENKIGNLNEERYKLVDIKNDGVNEVIVSYESKEISGREIGRIACYDNKQTRIWKFTLHDSLFTSLTETFNYTLQLVDTTTRNGVKELYLNASDASSNFPSMICRINLITGERIEGELLSAGRFNQAAFFEDSLSKKKYLIAGLFNNGFNKLGFVKINLASFSGQTISDATRTFKNKPVVSPLEYILLPNSDYNIYLKQEHSREISNTVKLDQARKRIVVTLLEGLDNSGEVITYEFSYDLKSVDIVTSSRFERARDSLVVQWKINPPKTFTLDYQKKVKGEILSWDGKKFTAQYKKSRKEAALN